MGLFFKNNYNMNYTIYNDYMSIFEKTTCEKYFYRIRLTIKVILFLIKKLIFINIG